MKRKKPFYLVRVIANIHRQILRLPFTETYNTIPDAEKFIEDHKKYWRHEANMGYEILRCVPVRKGARR